MATDVVSYMLLVTTGARLLVNGTFRRWKHAAWRLVLQRLLLAAILAVCGLPLGTSDTFLQLGAVILALALVDFLVLLASRESEAGKAWSIAAYVAITVLAFTTAPLSTGFNAMTRQITDVVFQNSTLAALMKGRLLHNASLYLAGMLLAGFELHHPIMWAIDRLAIAPDSTSSDLARGKVIGNLERPVVFILIITGNFVSLGLVFAAKTLTRFRRLGHQDFAEYYLIGTLLSFGSSALLAGLFWLFKAA